MVAKQKYYHPVLHIFAFCSVAIAQPVLDIIGRNPEFLIAQQTNASEIFLILFLLIVGIPFAFSIPLLVCNSIGSRASRFAFTVTLGLLAGMLVLMPLKRLVTLPDSALLALAVSISGGFLLLYWRKEAVRMFCTYISPAIVLVPMLFVINENVLRTVFISAEPQQSFATVADAPVVVVVFDEMPLITLLDENLAIDAARFPNFARLQEASHWFRNTHTVSSVTTLATPALLSGTLRTNALPVAADHPQNLFTVLSSSHELNSWEIVTRLCASPKCNENSTGANEPEIRGLLSDLSIVYLHLLSPPQFSQRLPVISQSWSNFANDAENLVPLSFNEFAVTERANSRVEEFRDFVQAIENQSEPALYFHHALLPHMPWEILPSGKLYSMLGSQVYGLDAISDQWGSDSFLVNQGYQRHLLQTVFVDTLLGELLDRLEQEAIFDDALIVVTSDHGATFRANQSRRNNDGVLNKYQVELVPLFVKLPGQSDSEVHQQAVSTVDIFPTIAGALNIPLVLNTQGIDLFGDEQREFIPQLMEGELSDDDESLAAKLALFGTGDTARIYQIGERSEFYGMTSADLNASIATEATYQLDQQAYFASVNEESTFIPGWLTGEILDSSQSSNNDLLLFAINGTVVALASSFFEEDSKRFSVLIPEDSIIPGTNTFEIFQNSVSDIQQIPSQAGRNFSYQAPGNRNSSRILEQNSTTLEFASNLVRGDLNVIRQTNGLVMLDIWAITQGSNEPVDYLLLDINGELTFVGEPEFERPDIVEFSGSSSALLSGWQITLPGSDEPENSPMSIRLLGVSGSEFGEVKWLNYIGGNSRQYQIQGETVLAPDGTVINIEPEAAGSIDLARVRNNIMDLEGWASDSAGVRQPDFYLLDNGGDLYYLGESSIVRPDLVEVFNEEGLRSAGFAFRVPVSLIDEPISNNIRLLAVTNDQATPVGSTSTLADRLAVAQD